VKQVSESLQSVAFLCFSENRANNVYIFRTCTHIVYLFCNFNFKGVIYHVRDNTVRPTWIRYQNKSYIFISDRIVHIWFICTFFYVYKILFYKCYNILGIFCPIWINLKEIINKFIKSLNIKVTTTSTLNYRLFKDKLEFEKYFDIRFTFCDFRTVNHKLPIEHGRWNNIQRENWVCNLCNSQNLGDEFHYIYWNVVFLSDMRNNCINNKFFRNANILKFWELMNQTKLSKLKKLCVFIRFINNNVCPPG